MARRRVTKAGTVVLEREPPPAVVGEEPVEQQPDPSRPPRDWILGALLNVRNTGPDYVVTLFPEEYDARKPERALRFANPAECQNFVSAWYARQHYDPRAL